MDRLRELIGRERSVSGVSQALNQTGTAEKSSIFMELP